MSDMHFREPNQVKWMGTRPGHNGTQVLEHLIDALAADGVIYTVPAGETLYLTYGHISSDANATFIIGLEIFTDGGVLHRWLIRGYNFLNSEFVNECRSWWPPIEIPAGYTVRKFSSGAASSLAVIHGWAE